MRTALSRSLHADQLEAEIREATCCTVANRCPRCTAKLGEVRAVRRDALMLSLRSMRQRRPV